jgi:hypothetical protein
VLPPWLSFGLPAFLLDLPLPHHVQARRLSILLPIGRDTSSPELGVIVGIVPPVAPAARDAADRKRCLPW